MLVIGSLGSSPYAQRDARGPLLPSVPLTNSLNSPHEARDDHEVISGPVSHRSPANFLCPGPSGSTSTAREQAGDRRGCHQMPNSSRLLRKISPFRITASYETHSLTPQETEVVGTKLKGCSGKTLPLGAFHPNSHCKKPHESGKTKQGASSQQVHGSGSLCVLPLASSFKPHCHHRILDTHGQPQHHRHQCWRCLLLPSSLAELPKTRHGWRGTGHPVCHRAPSSCPGPSRPSRGSCSMPGTPPHHAAKQPESLSYFLFSSDCN